MINDIQKSADSKMQRSLEVLKEILAKVRTGRPTPACSTR